MRAELIVTLEPAPWNKEATFDELIGSLEVEFIASTTFDPLTELLDSAFYCEAIEIDRDQFLASAW